MISDAEIFTAHRQIEEACSAAGHPRLYNRITLDWAPRAIKRLGQANPNTMTITLSVLPWQVICFAERRETVFHEVAHLVSWIEKGFDGWGHCDHWRAVMHRIGYPNAQRLVSREAALKINELYNRRPVTKHIALCGCKSALPEHVDARRRMPTGEHLLSGQRAKQKKRGLYYMCKSCKKTLLITGERVRFTGE